MTIQLQDVRVLDNPAPFTSNFKFQITFDCVAPGVKEELEWKLVYVGSADNDDNDQDLDQILVGPVRVGKNRFTFEAPSPDPTLIPCKDLLDVTVILLTCSYKEQEFIRIGYYVHNEYEDEIDENDENVQISPHKIRRNILSDKPRVTRFNINWDQSKSNKSKLVDTEETKEKENDNNNNNNDDNNRDEYEQEDEDDDVDGEDEDEVEDEDADEREDFEEDLADTEEFDNKNMNNDNNNNADQNNNHNNKNNDNNNNDNEEDDDDIDMTE